MQELVKYLLVFKNIYTFLHIWNSYLMFFDIVKNKGGKLKTEIWNGRMGDQKREEDQSPFCSCSIPLLN